MKQKLVGWGLREGAYLCKTCVCLLTACMLPRVQLTVATMPPWPLASRPVLILTRFYSWCYYSLNHQHGYHIIILAAQKLSITNNNKMTNNRKHTLFVPRAVAAGCAANVVGGWVGDPLSKPRVGPKPRASVRPPCVLTQSAV